MEHEKLLAMLSIELRAFSTVYLNFCIICIVNNNIYFLPTYFFKYTFQQIIYHFSFSFKYYFFIHFLFFFNLYLFFLYSLAKIIFFNKKCYVNNIFLQYFHNNHSKILCGKLLLVLI